MRLYEFECKRILSELGVQVPEGDLAETSAQAEAIAREIDSPVAVKAQVLFGARAKAGLVRFAGTAVEARRAAEAMLGQSHGKELVRSVLVERRWQVAQELYLGITIDPNEPVPVLLFSLQGGIDIERTASAGFAAVLRYPIDPRIGVQQHVVRDVARKADLTRQAIVAIGQTGTRLWQIFEATDAILAEINPLALLHDGSLIALDAKIETDSYAEARHPQFDPDRHRPDETQTERRARALGLSYVELGGNIAIAGNGAGLMMLTVDLLTRRGLRPANFCDAGGAIARPGSGRGAVDWWSSVVRVVLSNNRADTFFFNLHGGNHRGDEVAEGLLEGLDRSNRRLPTVVRLSGTREELGRKRLEQAGIHCEFSLPRAIDALVALSSGP